MKRLVTGIALVALAIYLIFFAPRVVFFAAALCMGILCYVEFSGLVTKHNIPRPGIFGIAGGLLILFWPEYLLLGFAILVVISLAVSLRSDNLSSILPHVGATLLAAFYAFAPWRFAIELRTQSVHLLFFALALNWIGDTAAYYVGRTFGRRRIAPIVSPKKSWEGALASVAASVIFGLVYIGRVLPGISWWVIIAIAISGNVAGQLGDLAESAVKRGAGAKDSGRLLPGHGGMLDRVDSSLFTLPVVYAIYFFSLLISHYRAPTY